ncbi:MAG TPA: peptidylprolyl isomerase, partial [Rhodothermia bacterium]|nr:peptidylprolyl isomerase [Rhodothermia bacterium]
AIADSIKTTEARFGSPKEYSAALSAKKLTRKDVERDTRKMLAVNRVLEEVVWKDIYIDNQAIRTFYEENREQFQHPDEMRVSEILIRVPRGATPAARGEARAKAERCLQRARAGEDFAAVAKSESEDETTAPQGGDLGFVSRGSLVEAVEEAAFRLKPGQVSEVMETPYGLHLVKVTDSRPAGVLPLDEVRERIIAVLTQERRLKEQDAFVADLRKSAAIEVAK